MNRTDWSKPVDSQTAHHRAGGRLRYNRQRQAAASIRSLTVFYCYTELRMSPAEIAQREGVHLSTVYRDIWLYRGKIRPHNAAVKAAQQAALAKAKKRGWL